MRRLGDEGDGFGRMHGVMEGKRSDPIHDRRKLVRALDLCWW